MELTGLTSEQVTERVAKGSRNVTSTTRTKRTREILLDNIFSVFNFIVLGVIAFIFYFYFRLGDTRLLLDVLRVFSIAFINTILAISQEIKAKKALDKVNLLLERVVTVIRNGEKVSISQSEIVVDDLIQIERGDQVVVDGRVTHSNHLEIDESLLTGESVPIFKSQNDEVLSGSFCVSGNGLYVAEKVGDACHAAQVTNLARKIKNTITPLQKKIDHIVEIMMIASVFLVVLELIFNPHASFDNVDFIRRLSTLVISLLPQGLVLLASITFALGVYRISKLGAIIQKLNAIESFSNVGIVCMDKTGTLTKNQLSVNRITLVNELYSREEAERLLGTYAKLSSDKNATLRTLDLFLADEQARLLGEIPFSSEKKMSLISVELSGRESIYIFGAFDLLLPAVTDKFRERANWLFEEGRLSVYRNILFGRVVDGTSLDELRADSSRLSIEPVCIISITDQVRDDVMEAIQLFQSHEINFKILSGDAPEAVQAVAREIGWDIPDDKLITGQQLDKIDDADFTEVILDKLIFARLRPNHKLRIIETFKREKIYTAMIGDGVNDLPAIKAADMGIAMEEGSKITKEVADIVLLKNRFSLLPSIFDEGNKIVNTVSAGAKLFLTKNFLVIYLILLSTFFHFDFPLTPGRVSLINIFAIALPSFVIALRNNNVNKTKNFTADLFSFVILSSLFITAAGLAGEHFTPMFYQINKSDSPMVIARWLKYKGDLEMVMLSIMIITSIASFFAVALHKGATNLRIYLLYGIGILAGYIFLATIKIDFFLLNWLRKLYEIEYLDSRYWGVVAIISLASAILLFIVQKLRERIIERWPA
ncbi:MAG: cation-transporting P-type ATPase [Acidobacteriota bacterium]|nr:cation-transporting P-type ATPase [Acidobacteriota bacterium]